MRHCKTVLVGWALCWAMGSGALSAQDDLPSGAEVLARFVQVTGGKDAYAAVKTQKVQGKVSIPQASIEGQLTLSFKEGVGILAVIDIQGLGETRRGLSGEVGWEQLPGQAPRRLSKPEVAEMIRSSDPDAAVNWKTYYEAVENLGTEKIGDEACYKLKLTTKDGREQIEFYSVESGLLVRIVTNQSTMLGDIEVVVNPSDYREVGGIKQAFKIKQDLPNGLSQIVEMSSIEVNPELSDDLFDLPEALQESKQP